MIAWFIIALQIATLVLLVGFVVYAVNRVQDAKETEKSIGNMLTLLKESSIEISAAVVEVKRATKHLKQDVDLATTEAAQRLGAVVRKAESVSHQNEVKEGGS